jgi:plasmid maintenance system killer protein
MRMGWCKQPELLNREGQHSIRINDQYRICFVWTAAGPQNDLIDAPRRYVDQISELAL